MNNFSWLPPKHIHLYLRQFSQSQRLKASYKIIPTCTCTYSYNKVTCLCPFRLHTKEVSLHVYFGILEYQNVRLPVSRIPRHRWHVSREQGNIIIVPRAILYVLLDNMQESNEFGILKYYTSN